MQPLMQAARQEVPIKLHLLFSVFSCSTFFVFDLANSCHLPVSTCNLHRKAPDQYISDIHSEDLVSHLKFIQEGRDKTK